MTTLKLKAATAAVFIGVCALAGCAKQQAAQTATPSPAVSIAPLPVRADVTFNFTDVSETTNGTLLRLRFEAHNTSKDPIQCDPSEFSIQFPDGRAVQADQSAENKCDPDSIDPGATSNATIFFDLKGGYTGPVTLMMTTNGVIVGKGNATIHT